MPQHDNPYSAPASDTFSSLHHILRSSWVMVGAIMGAFSGVVFLLFVEMVISPEFYSQSAWQSPSAFSERVFWATVVGAIGAMFGSTLGALLDTFSHFSGSVVDESVATDSEEETTETQSNTEE